MHTDGSHHRTVVAGDPRADPRFCAGPPEPRLVKRTTDVDDVPASHRSVADLGSEPELPSRVEDDREAVESGVPPRTPGRSAAPAHGGADG